MATFTDCLNTIRQAAPSLDEDQAMDLLDEVESILESKKADGTVADLQAAVQEAIQRRADDAERAALIEKRNAALNVQVRRRAQSKIDALIKSGRPDQVATYLESMTVGIAGDSQFKESIERTGRALEAQAHTLFHSELASRGVQVKEATKFMRSRDAGRLLIMEADKPGSSESNLAKAVSESIEATQEFMRTTANKHGADIGKIPGYLVKQGHDGDKMVTAGKEEWIEFILPHLDHERTFGPMPDAQKRVFLDKAFDNIVLGNAADVAADLGAPPGFKGPGNTGKKLSSRRALHFKRDGVSTWTYMQRFGNKDIGSAFAYGLDGMAKSTAAMIQLGPNPEYMLRELMETAKSKLRDNVPAHNRITENADTILGFYEEAVGVGGKLPSAMTYKGKLARATNWTKNITGSALLGGTTLSSIGDVGTAATRLNNIGVPFMEAHIGVLSGITRGRGDGQIREVAHSLNIGMEGLMSDVQAKWMGNDAGTGQGSFLVGSVMRVTGMNWLNDSLKTAAGLTLSNFVSKQAGKAFDALPPQLHREMSAYGIDAGQWESIRAAVSGVGGKTYIDGNQIADQLAQRRFREFTVGFTDSAVLTPGARTARLTRNLIGDGKRGDPLTEMSVLFTHLKSFSIAYFQEHLSRFYRSGDGIQFGYAMHLTLSALVYGYIAGALKDVVAGREPRPLDNPATWADAWLTGGGAGFYGDLVFAMTDQKKMPGGGILEQTAGPGLGLVFSGVGVVSDLATGDTTGAAVGANRIAKTVVPGSNIFYSRWLLDYMLWWPMAEYVKPGFARRVEKRAKEDRGHEYLPGMGPVAAAKSSPITQ